MNEHRKHTFLKNSGIVYVAFVIDFLLRLLLVRFVLLRLGNDVFATWGILKATVLFPLFVHQSLSFAVFLQRARGNRGPIVAEAVTIVLVFSGIISALLFLLAPTLSTFFRVPANLLDIAALGFRIYALSFLFTSVTQLFQNLLQGEGRFGLAGFVTILGSMCISGCSIYILNAGGELLSLLVIELVTSVILLPTIVWLWLRQSGPRQWGRFSAKQAALLLADASRQIAFGGSGKLLWELDGIVIPRVFGAAGMASYWLARRIPYLWGDFQWAGAWPAVSESAGGENTAARIRNIHLVQSFLAICAGAFLIAYASPLLILWVGPGYDQAAGLMRILVLAIGVDLIPSILLSGLFAREQVGPSTRILFSGAVLKIVLMIPACILMNQEWVLLSTLAGSILFGCGIVWLAQRELDIPMKWILSRLLLPLTAVIASLLLLQQIHTRISLLGLTFRAGGHLLLSGAIFLFLLKKCTPADYQFFRSFLAQSIPALARIIRVDRETPT